MKHLTSLLLFILVSLGGAAFAQQARPPIHVEVVLDSSGSMRTNDPQRLSALGAMIFSDLATPSDHLGVQSMKKPRYTLEPLGRVREARAKVRDAAKRVSFVGPTDCKGPLATAARELAKLRVQQPDARQFVIFLSDGECPGDVEPEAVSLNTDGVKIFSIGLFESLGEKDPEKALKRMATISGGEYFRAQRASDLPARFASILGRILGSEALPISFKPGAESKVSLDGYVKDASLVITGPREVRVTRAEGPDKKTLAIPGKRAPYESGGQGFFVSANNNGSQHYTVLSIAEPESGEWSFVIDAPLGASALLIQNYALEPKLDVGVSVLTIGSTSQVRCTLAGPDGKALQDPTFLDKVGVELEVVSPGGERKTVAMMRSNYRFAYDFAPQHPGRYQLQARAFMKGGGLNKKTVRHTLTAVDLALAFAEDVTIDLGTLKAGSVSKHFKISMQNSRLVEAIDLEAGLEGMPGVAPNPVTFRLDPNEPAIDVRFKVDPDHTGGPVEGSFVVSFQGDSASLRVVGVVVPITFWEQWGDVIIMIGAGLLGLFLLIFIFYGFISPHGFPDEARINWGESVARLDKNNIIVREIPKTGRGFYRNARLVVGGPSSYFSVSGAELVTLEATGSTQITIRAADGVELMRVNKFDHKKEKPVDSGSTGMTSGEIFRAGDIYLRLR